MGSARTAGVRHLRGRWAVLVALLGMATATLPMATSPGSHNSIVVLVSQLESSDLTPQHVVTSLGGRVIKDLPIIDGFAARVPESALGTLRSLPGIRSVTPDAKLHLEGLYGENSGTASAVYPDAVRATKSWPQGYTGNGVTIAMVDTGINTDGDLAGRVVHAEDFTSEQNNTDSYGHGTFVAGLIAGTGANSGGAIEGVAPNAKLVSLKIAGADGSTDVTRLLEALEWIVTFKDTYGIRIVNLSIGFDTHQSYLVDPLDFAVERVWNDGLVVVAAAGNGGNAPGTITAPGNDPLVITAGSSNDRTTGPINDDRVTSFSASGPTVDGLVKPDLIAPGRSLVSSRSPGSTIDTANPASEIDATYMKGSGTSFSTGIVSGVAALVLSRTPSLTPNQVKYRLMSTARTITGGTTPLTGAGTVDAFGATNSTSLLSANAGVAPALGGGSLQATRGPACLVDSTGQCMSDGDANAALGFDPTEYFSNDWAGSQWAGSQWAGSQWAGSQWAGSQWAGSQWTGSQWTGSQWSGSQWAGSQWVSDAWQMVGP